MNELRAFAKMALYSGYGWGCGYVVVPPGHPYHGADYDHVPVEVNGGLTFGERADDLANWPEITDADKGCWVFGFDTAHYGDTPEKWPDKQSVLAEANRLKKQLEKLWEQEKLLKED